MLTRSLGAVHSAFLNTEAKTSPKPEEQSTVPGRKLKMGMPCLTAVQANLQGPRHDAANCSVVDRVLTDKQRSPHALLVAGGITPGVVPKHSAHNGHSRHRGLDPAQQIANLHENDREHSKASGFRIGGEGLVPED